MTFIDASAWIAIFNPRDQWHEKARDYYEFLVDFDEILVTSNWTLYEALNRIKQVRYQLMIDLLDMGQRNLITIVKVNEAEENEALQLFVRPEYQSRGWSVIDCVNVICARNKNCGTLFHFNPRDYPELCSLYEIQAEPGE